MLVLLVRAAVLGAEAVGTAAIGAWAPWAGRQGMALRGMPLLGRGGGDGDPPETGQVAAVPAWVVLATLECEP